MSAFIVNPRAVALIVACTSSAFLSGVSATGRLGEPETEVSPLLTDRVITTDETDWGTFEDVCWLLAKENQKSVNYRYSERGRASFTYDRAYIEKYGFDLRMNRDRYNLAHDLIVQAIKGIDCLEYQSCEHPGWTRSKARRFLRTLKADLISEISDNIPGYAGSDWEPCRS